jgi:nucleotide-binding universal stress UspA family protein
MEIKKILVPYNFTDLDRKALDFVIRTFSNAEEAEVTVFNIYTPVPSITMKDSPEMKKMQASLSYLHQLISEQEENLKQAKQILISGGFAADHVNLVFKAKKKDVSTHIVEMAKEERFDLIVINRKPGKVSRFFTKSVFGRVVASLNDTIVCIVS